MTSCYHFNKEWVHRLRILSIRELCRMMMSFLVWFDQRAVVWYGGTSVNRSCGQRWVWECQPAGLLRFLLTLSLMFPYSRICCLEYSNKYGTTLVIEFGPRTLSMECWYGMVGYHNTYIESLPYRYAITAK
jgi:hypothetical protein